MGEFKWINRTAALGISLLSFSAILNAALAFAVQFLLVRVLRPDVYGVFAGSLASVTLVGALAGFGLPQLWLRLLGESAANARLYLDSSIKLISLTTLFAILLMLIWATTQAAPLVRSVLLILAVCLPTQTAVDLLSTQFQHQGRIGLLSLNSMAQNAVRLSGVIGIVLVFGGNLSATMIAFAYAAASITIITISFFTTRAFIRDQNYVERDNQRSLAETVRRSLPFGAAIFFQLAYYLSPVVVLQFLSTPAEAGYYNIAFVFVSAAYILPTAIFQQFYLPRIHARSFTEPAWVEAFTLRSAMSIGAAGLLVALGFWVMADYLIIHLVGTEYAASAQIIRILVLGTPAIYVAYCYGAILSTRDNMWMKTAILAAISIFSITLNAALAPTRGGEGAAWTAVFSAWLLVALYLAAARVALQRMKRSTVKNCES